MGIKTKRPDGGDAEIPGDNTWLRGRGGNITIQGGGLVAQRSGFRDFISRSYIMNLLISALMVVAIYGVIVGAGWALPAYSWGCIGFLVGVINPIGRPKRS